MDKRAISVIGAVGALACLTGAAAAAPLPVQTYADLLAPIENPAQALAAMDAQSSASDAGASVEMVQYRHHHHHHHHRMRVPRFIPRSFHRHHHHHHHHHHHYRRDY
jgi:hypothetical protein